MGSVVTIRSVLALLCGLAALACVGLVALTVRQMLIASGNEVERARVARVLSGLVTSTETNLAIGLSLDNLGMLQPQLERERSADPRLLALDIFAIGGRSAFSTDRGAVGETVPDSWTERARAETSGIWRVEERGEIAYGRTVLNDIGLPVAGIVVTLSATDRARTQAEIDFRLAPIALPVALAAAAAAALAGFLGGQALERPFARIADRLAASPAAPGEGRSQSLSPAEREAMAAAAAWTDAQEWQVSALRRLESFDDAA